MTIYVSISTGEPFGGVVPDPIPLYTSGGERDGVFYSIETTYPKGSSDYQKALDQWMLLEGYVPQVSEGGLGSGNFGHAGRPGKVGGSQSQGVMPIEPRPGTKFGLPTEATMNFYRRVEFIRERLEGKIRVRNVSLADTKKEPDAVEECKTRVADMLARQPPQVIESFLHYGKVEFMTGEGSLEKETRALYRRYGVEGVKSGVGAFYDPVRSTLVFRLSDRQNYEYFTHELGHFAYFHSSYKGKWTSIYDSVPKFDRHTSYSSKNSWEGFAESYFSYVSQNRHYDNTPIVDDSVWETFQEVEKVIKGVRR